MSNIYNQNLDKNRANYEPLSPLSFIKRSATLFPDWPAIVHGEMERSWSEMYQRCIRMASALHKRGIADGDTVAVMLPNIPEMFEVHFAVPMSGGVLNAINTRLDAATVAFILKHAEAKILITDSEYSDVVKAALAMLEEDILVIDSEDPLWNEGEKLGEMGYEALLAEGDENYDWQMPGDEWDAISLNYTSGTTGDPKGVVFHHRGAYLNAVNISISWNMGHHPRYLWTLPMFHCNGWCFPWTMSVIAGTHICLRQVRQKAMWDALADHQVTHLCGAPIVMSTLLSADEKDKRQLNQEVEFFTAAAPPPEAVLAAMKEAGFNVTHLYGLTETYGPAVVNDWHQAWDELDLGQQAAKKSRQGVRYVCLEDLSVRDPETMLPTPQDGETIGEIMFRGNVVMKGYLGNREATADAFEGGWFHSGDLGVIHEDGYIQLKDRSKDIIISGGENISSIEVEDALYKHAGIEAAAVVAMEDEKWGETPCAFVETNGNGEDLSEQEVVDWCKQHLAHFKVPRRILFEEIPKTSTGKIQKYILRQRVKSL